MIKNERFIQWMNVVRNNTGSEQFTILENFWESQITSKQWLIDVICDLDLSCQGNIYIFGGWFGVLGGMLRDKFTAIENVYSIDSDPQTAFFGKQLNADVNFVICDMKDIVFTNTPSLVINTSTEHITQEIFDSWLNKIPSEVPIILQGNNFFTCNGHIRCSSNLQQFKIDNPLSITKYEGELDCKQFTRFMTIGYKK